MQLNCFFISWIDCLF